VDTGKLGGAVVPRIRERHAAQADRRVDAVDEDDAEACAMQPVRDGTCDLVAPKHERDGTRLALRPERDGRAFGLQREGFGHVERLRAIDGRKIPAAARAYGTTAV
jgi:hypothetical protein